VLAFGILSQFWLATLSYHSKIGLSIHTKGVTIVWLSVPGGLRSEIISSPFPRSWSNILHLPEATWNGDAWVLGIPWWLLVLPLLIAMFFFSHKHWLKPMGVTSLSPTTSNAVADGTLEYAAPKPELLRHWVRAIRNTCATTLLTILGIVVWKLGLAAYHQAMILHWQEKCLTYAASPTQVVCDEDPARASILLATSPAEYADYWLHPHDNHFMNFTKTVAGTGPAAVRVAPPWANLSAHLDLRPHEPNFDRGATLFCGERFTPSGQRRLLIIQYTPCPTEYLYFSPCVDIVAVVIVPGSGFTPPRDVTSVINHAVWLTALVVPPPIRMYAGQPDAANRSRFTVHYDVGPNSDDVDGMLNDDNSVTLTPRKPILGRGY